VGKIHRFSPQRVDGGPLADETAGHRSAVDSDPHGQRRVVPVVEAFQNVDEFPGESDRPAGVIDSGHHQPARCEQAVVLHAAHPLDAVAFGCTVERLDQRVQHRHRLLRGQRPGEFVEAQ
jgi:hypothetical protein